MGENSAKLAKVIAIGNQKGGVAKSTTCYNIGASLAKRGKKVLMIDMDAQASLTFICGFEHPEDLNGHNVVDVLETQDPNFDPMTCVTKIDFDALYEALANDEQKVRKNAITTDNLYLMGADIILSGTELSLPGRISRESVLKRQIDKIKHLFDFILIDCPPSLGIMTINSLVACDYVISCATPKIQSMRGLNYYLQNLERIRFQTDRDFKHLGVVITIKESDSDSNSVMSLISENEEILTTIPKTVKVSAYESYGLPAVFMYPSIVPSIHYDELAKTLIDMFCK